MVLSIFACWRGEEHPRLILRHRGVGDAQALGGVGFGFQETSVALAFGGNALAGAFDKLAGVFGHMVFNKKARWCGLGEVWCGLLTVSVQRVECSNSHQQRTRHKNALFSVGLAAAGDVGELNGRGHDAPPCLTDWEARSNVFTSRSVMK